MTDMDEIRELLSEYADAVFDRGAASGASNEVYPPNAGETSSRSALLQRVEALREEGDRAREAAQHYSDAQDRADERRAAAEAERDAALAAQKRAEEERDEAREQNAHYLETYSEIARKAKARAEAAESALAALRDALESAEHCIVAFARRLGHAESEVAALADVRAALAPAPPAALRPPENKEDPTP